MTKEEREKARAIINSYEPTFLTRAKNKGYICPKCGNGSGTDGTGITPYINNAGKKKWSCFKCGEVNDDVMALCKMYLNTEKEDDVFKYFSLEVDNLKDYQSKPKATATTKTETPKDETEYFKKCMEQVGETDYFKNRGLSDDVIKKYLLGYDENYIDKATQHKWKAAIIPTSKGTYVARNTDTNADNKDRYRKQGASKIYLKDKLYNSMQPVFVTEGEFDALSIIEVGGEAIGMGSASNKNKFVDVLKEKKPTQPIILAIDNDEAGKTAASWIESECNKLNIKCYKADIYGDCKDANEMLMKSKEALKEAVANELKKVKDAMTKENEKALNEYINTNSTTAYIQDFLNGISESANTPYIPTGFEMLDATLDGGLYEGLYIVSAIPSLGKTTLVLQIADSIAAAGNDVLIISLEMARSELMAKSISRLTLTKANEQGINVYNNAKTTRGITTGKKYKYYNPTEIELIRSAVDAYSEFAKHLFIYEGMGDISAEKVRERIEEHINITGKKPVVIIDYIQILSPMNERLTDKMNIDKSVLTLKRTSRDFKIPIICISSLNRQSYKDKATLDGGKESGSLEYGADCFFGLQLKGAGTSAFDVDEAKSKNPREIELVILKNRNGATGGKISFEYYPKFNYFEEKGKI